MGDTIVFEGFGAPKKDISKTSLYVRAVSWRWAICANAEVQLEGKSVLLARGLT